MTNTNGDARNAAGINWPDMTATMAELTTNMAEMNAKVYEETEKLWTGPLQEFMGSELFVKWLETGREAYLNQVNLSSDSLEQYWTAVRLPHKGDIANLAGQVVTVETKVENLDEQLDAVMSRMGVLENMLSRIEAKLDQAGTAAATAAAAALKTDRKLGKE